MIDVLSSIEIAFTKEPLLAVISFYCDESGKYRRNPVVAVTGVGATKEHLESFSREWEDLLRAYGIGDELHMSRVAEPTQACGSKMPANQTIEQRIEGLLPFANCINDHLEIGLILAWDVKGYNNLPLEVKKCLGGSNDPYHVAFIRGVLEIIEYAGTGNVVSVVADDDELTAWDAYIHYRAIQKAVPELGKNLAAITFAKSQHFCPLQAADMAAFLTRREARAEFYGAPNEFKTLLDYLASGPRANSRGKMKWFKQFAGGQNLVDLGNAVMNGKKPRI
jgi:hypothetical protein